MKGGILCWALRALAFKIGHGWGQNGEDLRPQSNPAAVVQYMWGSCCQYLEAGRLSSSSCYSRWCFPEEDTLTPVAHWNCWTGEGRCWLLDQREECWVLEDTDNTESHIIVNEVMDPDHTGKDENGKTTWGSIASLLFMSKPCGLHSHTHHLKTSSWAFFTIF